MGGLWLRQRGGQGRGLWVGWVSECQVERHRRRSGIKAQGGVPFLSSPRDLLPSNVKYNKMRGGHFSLSHRGPRTDGTGLVEAGVSGSSSVQHCTCHR